MPIEDSAVGNLRPSIVVLQTEATLTTMQSLNLVAMVVAQVQGLKVCSQMRDHLRKPGFITARAVKASC